MRLRHDAPWLMDDEWLAPAALEPHFGEAADHVALLVLRLLFFRIAQRLELFQFRVALGLALEADVSAPELVMRGGQVRLGGDDALKLAGCFSEAAVAHVNLGPRQPRR